MSDAVAYLATHSWIPISVLVCASWIVIVEATRDSRTALWGDLFVEDLED